MPMQGCCHKAHVVVGYLFVYLSINLFIFKLPKVLGKLEPLVSC